MNQAFPAIQLIVNTSSAEELNEKVVSLARQFGVELPSKTSELNVKVSEPTEKQGEKKTRKPKEDKPEIAETTKAETPKEEQKSETTSELPKGTLEDVKKSLQELSKVKGIEVLKQFLGTFKASSGEPCAKVSDIQESDYAEIIVKAREKAQEKA